MAFITVKEFNQAHEALIAKSFLEEEGIIAFIKGDLTIRTDHFFIQSEGFIKLQVHEKDIEFALELLKDFKDNSYEEKLSENAITYKKSEIDISKCPNCNSINCSKSKEAKGLTWLLNLLTNLSFFKAEKDYYCFDCSYKWRVNRK